MRMKNGQPSATTTFAANISWAEPNPALSMAALAEAYAAGLARKEHFLVSERLRSAHVHRPPAYICGARNGAARNPEGQEPGQTAFSRPPFPAKLGWSASPHLNHTQSFASVPGQPWPLRGAAVGLAAWTGEFRRQNL